MNSHYLAKASLDCRAACRAWLGKILGHRQVKKLGPETLKPILQVLGLKLLVIEDDRETALTLSIREPVKSSQQRFGNVSRLTPKLLPAPRQAKGQPSLSIVRNQQKRGTKWG
jgi:hypothetical protein